MYKKIFTITAHFQKQRNIFKAFTKSFIISKKKNLSIFWTIRIFYRKKTDLYEKKNPSLCRLPRKVWLLTSILPVQLTDFSFWISERFGPQSILLIFGLGNSVVNSVHIYEFWLLFYFYVKYPPI
jgi:hypothetical protein